MHQIPLLLRLWREVFQREDIAVHDTFLALGGTEALATRLVARISAATGVAVSVHMIFEAPTIAEFAVLLDQMSDLPPYRPIPRHTRERRTRASAAPGSPASWEDQNRKDRSAKPQHLSDLSPAVPLPSHLEWDTPQMRRE